MSKQSEYLKCYGDKTRIYFIENYLSTYNADMRKEVPFTLFPRQKVFLKSVVEHQNSIAIKHRQAGITTVTAAWVAGQCVFADKKSPETVLCIGNNMDISQQLLEKMAAFLDQVPRWMWGSDYYSPDPDSPRNSKSIYRVRNQKMIELFNGCRLYARSSGTSAARGISAVSILIFDEAAFIKDGPAVYAQAVAAQSSLGEAAKCIMVSTPHGKDQLYYRTYSMALAGENNYTPVEFKWYQDPRYNKNLKWYKQNESTGEKEWDVDPVISQRGDIEYNEERWRQLERDGWTPTSPWFERMCKSFNNDELKIASELLVSFVGSSDNVVSPEVIEMQRKQNVIEITDDWPLKDLFIKNTWIWKDPIPDHRYILSCDASTGSSEDRTAIEVIDIDAVDENGVPCFEQVLEYYGKMTGDEVGEMIFNYATTYNNALVVIDCIGGYGDAAVLTLMNLKYENLYYDEPNLKTYVASKPYSQRNNNETLPGFRSNNLRFQTLSNFVTLIKTNALRIRSTRVITELETWVWKNGRPDHMDGCHDDSITCLAMGCFVLQYYLLRADSARKRDSAIVRSWRVNNGANTDFNTRHLSGTMSIEPERPMPFYTTSMASRDKQKRVNAMLMLAGFKVRK